MLLFSSLSFIFYSLTSEKIVVDWSLVDGDFEELLPQTRRVDAQTIRQHLLEGIRRWPDVLRLFFRQQPSPLLAMVLGYFRFIFAVVFRRICQSAVALNHVSLVVDFVAYSVTLCSCHSP